MTGRREGGREDGGEEKKSVVGWWGGGQEGSLDSRSQIAEVKRASGGGGLSAETRSLIKSYRRRRGT